MKRTIAFLTVCIICLGFFSINSEYIKLEDLKTTRVYPEKDSTCYVEFNLKGKNLDAVIHNIVPDYWYDEYIAPNEDFGAAVTLENGKISIYTSAQFMMHACEPKRYFETQPFYDISFTIPNFTAGAYTLVLNINSYNIREFTSTSSVIIAGCPFIAKLDNQKCNDIVREGIEWVLYQPEPDNRVKFYRMQFKGKADVFFAGDGETVKDASRLFLYTGATLDEERDPVIAYFKPSGPLNARRIAADVDIPIGFWASWGTTPPSETINPYKMFRDSGDVSRLMSLVGENFTLSQLPEEEKTDAKWYWEDYISGTMRPMFKQAYIDETGDSGTPCYALTMSENMDGTGYQGRWESGVGPVGEDYASNLPYPVYSLDRGIVPTALLYVRDINTNEILWGDPKLDPSYNSVGGITAEPAVEVYGGDGVIEVRGEGNVKIYTLSGVLSGGADAPATLSVSPGIYIAVSGTESKKIIVR